jgi:Domain of unknown function (DUF6378)
MHNGDKMDSRAKLTIFEEAQNIIYGDRERTYGHPSKNLSNISLFWRTYVVARFGKEIEFEAVDVCAMMRLLKEARLINQPEHRDSIVDLCGYAGLQDRIMNDDSGRTSKS